ncbi:MAG TPA: hypothetical protein VF590_04530 [Isosphaeraceae bacterium]
MRHRVPSLLLLVAVSCPLPRAVGAEERKADVTLGVRLLAEGDALADKHETTEAVLRYKQAFEHILPAMRKLPFKNEVPRDVTPRAELGDYLRREIDREMPPEEFRANELGMKALGLLPREVDLKATQIKLLTEQIAAFYDTRTKTMHLIQEPEAEAKKTPSFLERLLGQAGGFDKDENKGVIAHELTHALADQNFDIEALQDATKGDDDRTAALVALVEGEAFLTMMGAQLRDWDGTETAKLPAEDLDRAMRFMGPVMGILGGASLRDVPPILSESLMFSYLRGIVFCAHLTNRGGWAALDAAYREPPLSTEQILHPEKYRTKPDAPLAIDLGRLDPGPGWTEVVRNVVGEMQLGVLLRRHGGKPAAAGWDGDTFAAFEGPDQRLGLVWLSTWDTEADAREFAAAYARFQTTKLGPDEPEPKDDPAALRRTHDGSVYAVARRGLDVAVVEGFPGPLTDTLLAAAFEAKKAEKTHAPVAKAQEDGEREKAEK